ncbi:hypothetical protein [Nocardia sp. MH4]|uniref:hypothetical protein n=1 Tax=Nocardia sp. MH4 TaxID=1768677 RepID=UPI001C500F1B|nr:hypothetical protein [Nocardia sp. MH4]
MISRNSAGQSSTGALVEDHQFRFDEGVPGAPAHPAQIDAAFEMNLHGSMRLVGRQKTGIDMAVRNRRNY